MRGFSLLETMIALVVLTFGLLAAGQMLFILGSSASLERSKGTAALAAQDRLESLAALYRQDPTTPDLGYGGHGPQLTEIKNPVDGSVLNRYDVTWTVNPVPDPRPGKLLDARLLTVTVTPVLSGGVVNNKAGQNKIVNITTILSPGSE